MVMKAERVIIRVNSIICIRIGTESGSLRAIRCAHGAAGLGASCPAQLRWTYASVNAAHIVGIALLFGAIVPLDLRLMGWRRTVPIGTMARVLLPVAIAGLAALVAGLALFLSAPPNMPRPVCFN